MAIYTLYSRTGFDSFEEMYKAEHPFVFNVIKSRVRDSALAEDLAQDTFVRALCNIDTYAPQENKPLRNSFRSWIGTIAKHEVSRYFTRRNSEQKYSERGESTFGEYNYNCSTGAEDLLHMKQGLEGTMQAIESISNPEMRETARLWFVEDLKYKEISSQLGISRGTVMSRLNRVKSKLNKVKDKLKVSFSGNASYEHD